MKLKDHIQPLVDLIEKADEQIHYFHWISEFQMDYLNDERLDKIDAKFPDKRSINHGEYCGLKEETLNAHNPALIEAADAVLEAVGAMSLTDKVYATGLISIGDCADARKKVLETFENYKRVAGGES